MIRARKIIYGDCRPCIPAGPSAIALAFLSHKRDRLQGHGRFDLHRNIGNQPLIAAPPDEIVKLSVALRQRTMALHAQAERSGIINALLRGKASLAGYVRLQQCLLPVYEAIESALDSRHDDPILGNIVRPELWRAHRLRCDIAKLSGLAGLGAWTLPIEASQYTAIIHNAGGGNAERLIAHSYVRYLGDLSGGQILQKRLAGTFGIDPDCLTFYDFPTIRDIGAYKEAYRAALDRAALGFGAMEPILQEAETAFEMNIAVSEAVWKLTDGRSR